MTAEKVSMDIAVAMARWAFLYGLILGAAIAVLVVGLAAR